MGFDLSTAKSVEPAPSGFDLRSARPAGEDAVAVAPEQPASMVDKALGHPASRFLMGMASPVVAAGQLGANIGDKIVEATGGTPVVGKYINEKLADLEAAKQRGMKASGNGGFDVMGLLGNLAPASFIGNAVTKALPAATTFGSRLAQGAATGAVGAATTPVTSPGNFFTDKAKQVGTGAVLGAAIPAVAQAGMAAKASVEPFYQKGREQIIGRALTAASGGQESKVMQDLQNARELVPGSAPTVAQATVNPGLASLEKAASAISPDVKVAYAGREAAQNEARKKIIDSIAGTDADRAFAEQARKAATSPLLNALSQSTAVVDPQRTVNLIDRMLANSAGRTKLTNTLEGVKRSLYDDSGNLRSNAAQLYQGARKNITDLLAEKAGDGSKANEAISKELTVIMKSLDHQINKVEPAYGQFMNDYASMSKPINRMDVGREIADKSVNKLTDVVQPNAYVNALSDKTAQRATGFKRATLEGTMTPGQMNSLNALKDDVVRAVAAREAARTRGSDTVQNLAYSNLIDRAGVPTFLREFAPTQVVGNLLARASDTVYGRANKEIANQLAMGLLSPSDALRMMQSAGPSKYAPMIDEIMRRSYGPAGAIGGAMVNQGR